MFPRCDDTIPWEAKQITGSGQRGHAMPDGCCPPATLAQVHDPDL